MKIKLELHVVAPDLKGVAETLRMLSEEWLRGDVESNCCGEEGENSFDYSFVESDDLWSNDDDKPTIDPIIDPK
jgi:hypothetical protein